jgi:hypothetical protein
VKPDQKVSAEAATMRQRAVNSLPSVSVHSSCFIGGHEGFNKSGYTVERGSPGLSRRSVFGASAAIVLQRALSNKALALSRCVLLPSAASPLMRHPASIKVFCAVATSVVLLADGAGGATM